MTLISPPVRAIPGSFLQPSSELEHVEDLALELGLTIYSGYRAPIENFRGENRIFDAIIDGMRATTLRCEDQCSPQHYFDLFEVVRAHVGRIDRLVEVGVFMGGSASILAGCLTAMDLTLDLVDISPKYLLFTYERIRRTFPEAAKRVRLFQGDLPTYVHDVLIHESATSALVHHDGAHDFNQVVKDLSSLYFVRDKVKSLAIQDTHLRGKIDMFNFVDAALYAVFGFEVACQPLGIRYPEGHMAVEPNQYQGNYFLPGAAEGACISFAANTFKYPHRSMKLEEFLPRRS